MSQIIPGKVVVVGDTQVGKTAIVNKYNNIVDGAQETTVAANSIKCVVPLDGEEVSLSVWDTAGQENFKCLLPMYSRGAQVGLVVFDINRPETFSHLDEWIRYLTDQGECSIVIVANKSDLEHKVDLDDVQSFARARGYEYYQTSALTGDGIDLLFQAVATIVHSCQNQRAAATTVEFKPAQAEENEQKSGCC
ncbi:Ras-related protein Rab-5B [Tritrichomonas foetus]|uniref:Ras-related protein Rab-5B n=1 Tax=Tritrichomonas foetus TaxID=1144522 RepID=A0A1J4K6C2_9EUKA|nr:Ras-related protein Rab-5B [Tritrichomonas foetus]|eukprot:OHT06967.1 Ras-related protein Rab-5B [Tritrichomonas foetus]